MTYEQFVKVCNEAVLFIRKRAPIDTGNLRYNAIQFRYVSPTQIEIFVSGDGTSGIAPYMPFTNEPWIAPRWNDKKNPNEGWWQKAIEDLVAYLAANLKGVVIKV